MGTIVGSAVIVYLARSPHSPFYCGLGPTAGFNLGDLGFKELTGLAGLGFAYCYIASAPMLVLHTARAQLGKRPLWAKWRLWICTLVPLAALYFVLQRWLSIRLCSYQTLGLVLFLAIVSTQIVAIIVACRDRFETINLFYLELARWRASKEECVREYAESYRHLREHGNAFAIVLLEFVLGLVLATAQQEALAIFATVFWILPSSFTWYIGTRLESKLPDPTKK
ncbi:MAG: hypothetical protein WBL70_19075 [Candidatus Acidiferrales bacterium]